MCRLCCFVFHELVKISWEKLGFWFVYVLINYMRLCCKVLKRKVVFEPLDERETRCMVLFWKIRWKIFWGLWKYFPKCFWVVFWGQSGLKLLWHVVSLFTLKTCLKMITGRLRPVIKLVLGFGFDFGNENQITCTRSNQQAFGKWIACLWKWFAFASWKDVGN